jgi:hypothetical protein
MPPHSRSFAADAALAAATARPVPRGIAFRAHDGQEAEAERAAQAVLPGWTWRG